MRFRSEVFNTFEWKRVFKIAIVIFPVLAWDLFYFLLCKFKDFCDVIDERGGEFFEKFVSGETK